MHNTAEIHTVLSIRVPSGHTVMAKSQAAARQKAERYVADLLAALGVPTAFKIVWEKQPPGAKTVEATINGKPTRLRHTTVNSLGVPPADFCVALCEDVLRNRALFVTPALLRQSAAKAHPSFQRFEEKHQERIVQTIFAQGFGLQRIEQHTPPTGSTDNTLEAWAEACIGDLEATRLTILAHPSQIDLDDDPSDFNRLIESAGYFVDAAFKVKGIPYPKIKGEKRSDFAPDEMAFQINDLPFPTRKMGDVQAENLNFVNFLTNHGALFINRGAVNFLLDSLETANPNLLALVRNRFGTDFIAAVLRNLAAEGISIRPLVRILEILAGGGQDTYRQQPALSEAPPLSETIHLTMTDKTLDYLDMSDRSELVRINLKNAIINRALPHFDEPFVLNALSFDTALLEKIARFDTLSQSEQSDLCAAMHRRIWENHNTPAGKIRPVVAPAGWRKKISELIAFEFPDTPVFSLQECLPRIVARFG